MEIDEAINKWLKLLDGKLNGVYDKNEIWGHCVLVTAIVRDYSKTVLQLLNENKSLPAQVVLRSLAEIVIKTCWCIQDARENIKSYHEKNQRLSKSALLEQKKFLKRAHECFDDSNIYANLQQNENWLRKLSHVKEAPNNLELCKELFGDRGQLYYQILFGQIHQVVHADLAWMQKLRISGIGEIYANGDDAVIFKQISAACIYLILKHIYNHYGLEYSDISSEYDVIKNS